MQDTLPEIEFLKESDKLKSILRRTSIHDQSRRENSAEHSWQLALAVIAASHLANEPVNIERSLKMALIHDLVEIDAGDTFIYDTKALEDKFERELKAADRIFGLIPKKGGELRQLWLDYEKQACPESRFVNALDRFLPVLLNYVNEGLGWRTNNVKTAQILKKNSQIDSGSKTLWLMAKRMIEETAERGFIES